MSESRLEQPKEKTVCRDPASGKILGYSPLSSVEELKNIVAKARVAQEPWAALGFKERANHMLRVRDYLVENCEKIAEVISRDTGKTRVDGLSTEVMPAAMAVDYYIRHARKFLQQ